MPRYNVDLVVTLPERWSPGCEIVATCITRRMEESEVG